jgi:hypothetical protein
LGVDLNTPAPGERVPQDAAVLRKEVRIAIAVLLKELRRALYVREQEGDGP